MIDILNSLENFYKRTNKIEFDVSCLKTEKYELKHENTKLIRLLKNYLIDITLENGTYLNAQNRMSNFNNNRPQSMQIEKIIHLDFDQRKKRLNSSSTNKKRPETCACIINDNSSSRSNLKTTIQTFLPKSNSRISTRSEIL